MGKIHYRDDSVTKYVPHYIQYEYIEKGMRGAACGFVRKRTTRNIEDVTCFWCKQKLRANNLL